MSENKSKLSKLTQSSKSTSRKKPHREFPAATSTFSGLVVALLLGLFGVANTYADSSITISLSGAVNLNLMGGNSEGVFGKSSSATASVETNNYTGYTFTITGNNNTGALVGANDQNHTIPSITTPLTESAFNTSTYNNKWGFLPSKIDSITNTEYQPSPTLISSTTIDVTKSANTGNPNSYTLAVAARVDDNTPNDHYSGSFTLAATGNATEYHIAYVDANNNMPGITYGASNSGTAQISSVTPHKDGYTFGGWCTVSVKVGQDCVSSGGTVISVGGDYTLDSATANNTNLYAIWTPATFETAFATAGKSKVGALYKMQDMTASICSSVTTPTGSATTIDLTGAHAGDTNYVQRTTLYDERDGNTYLVSKLADGHCWMSQNLALELTANTAVTAYNFNTGATFDYTPTYTTQTVVDGTTWSLNGSDGARSYGGEKDKYVGGTDITTAATISTSGQPYEKIGILYNWTAATAQSGSAAAAAGSSGETTVATSICPKNWRLPANSGDYSFSVLMGSYGLPTTNQSQDYSAQLQNPLNFNRPGNYNPANGEYNDLGKYGNFWSAVSDTPEAARFLAFGHNLFFPQRRDFKGYGFSLRCVAV